MNYTLCYKLNISDIPYNYSSCCELQFASHIYLNVLLSSQCVRLKNFNFLH
jgi:hypothetical protein